MIPISEKLRVPPYSLVLALLFVMVFFIVIGLGSGIMASIIGVVYPVLKSIQALETKDNDDDDKVWLTYWVVYGLLRTKDAVTPSLTTNDVLISLTGYVLVYAVLMSFGMRYIYRLLRTGPTGPVPVPVDATPQRPMALAGEPE